MKSVFYRSLVPFLFFIFFFNVSLFSQNSITLTSPEGGESWPYGSTHDITWVSSGVNNVKIQYSIDDGVTWISITESYASTSKKYSWLVPATISEKCVIKISDVLDEAVSDASKYISIVAPSAPNLSAPLDGAVSISPSGSTFTWDPVTGATLYRIQISENIGMTSLIVNQTTDKTTYSYSQTLKNNVTYYWRVLAIVLDNSTSYSSIRTFTTKLETPVLSSPSDKSEVRTDQVSLSWNTVAGANTYTLEVSAYSNFSSVLPNLKGLTELSKSLNGLLDNQLYYWRVKAIQTGGNTSDYSTVSTFATRRAGPSLVSPADETKNYNLAKVEYHWNVVPDAVSYDLQVCDKNTFDTPNLKNYPDIKDTKYTPSDFLKYKTQYFWRVRAKFGTTYSVYSSIYDLTIGEPKSTTPTDDANAQIEFDHENGRISQITYMGGSKAPLLNSNLNKNNYTGLGRIKGETKSKLVSWSEDDVTKKYEYFYENQIYGSKKLTIAWGTDGITVDMDLNLDPNKTVVTSAAWQPGGDIGPINDFILYSASTDTLTKTNLIYPGVTSAVYDGELFFTAMSDKRYNEFFGYNFISSVPTVIQQGAALLGPSFTYKTATVPKTFNLKFAVKNKDNFFTWANKKYLFVTLPAKSEKYVNKASVNIAWERYGVSSTVDVSLSTDGGSTFMNPALGTGAADEDSHSFVLTDLTNKLPLMDKCVIKISGDGVSDTTGKFSIIAAMPTTFSIANDLTGAPTAKVDVPVSIKPLTGDNINAFDVRVEYDKNLLTFVDKSYNSTFNKWTVDATNNPTLGYVQVGGFKNSDGTSITSDSPDKTLFKLTFYIKPNARVGTQTRFKINNSYLSAAKGDNAQKLTVAGEDGVLTFYSRVSGYLRYIISKKTIAGSNIIKFENKDFPGEEETFSTESKGIFDFSNKIPGSQVKITPDITKALPDQIVSAVDAIDAAKAFAGREGGPAVLSDLQKIAADVNSDSTVNSTDAFEILQLSTGAITHDDLNLDHWVFVDSTFKLSSSNWSKAPHYKIYSPLDTVRANQSFWGMILGDVDGDYAPPALLNSPDFSPVVNSMTISSAVLSVPSDLKGRPGDTLYLPLNVTLNGNNIGAFNTSLQLDKNLFTYCGRYSEGTSFPLDKGWTLSAHFDSTGKLNVGATDFSGSLDPITKDGTIAIFKFIVNNKAKLGDTCQVALSGLSVADSKLAPVTVSTKNGRVTITNATSVERGVVISDYSVAQNYPNPFNPSTTIEYALPNDSRVEIEVFNSIGQKIAVLFNGMQSGGYHKVDWNAKSMASGIYFYSIKATSLTDGKDFNAIRKMILMK